MKPTVPLAWFVPLLLLAIATSGCVQTDRVSSESCYDIHCVRVPDTATSRYLQDEYGVEQWEFTPELSKSGPRIEGDWVVWQFGRIENDQAAADIYGYNFVNHEIIPVAVGESVVATRHEIHENLVVYAEVPFAGSVGESPLKLWDAETGIKRAIPTSIPGKLLPSGFDGEWVLVDTLGAGNQSGQYAVNVDDGRTHLLRKDLPGPRHPNGTAELLAGLSLANGYAYVAVLINYENGTAFTNIWQYDLEDNATRSLFHHLPQVQVNEIDAGSRYVTWEGVRAAPADVAFVGAKDRFTGEVHGPYGGQEGEMYRDPRTNGDWVVYLNTPRAAIGSVKAVHLSTGQHHTLIPEGAEIQATRMDTDGTRVYFTGLVSDSGWPDSSGYLMALPSIE